MTMTSLNINAYRLSVMAAGVVGLSGRRSSRPLPQQQQQQIPQGWFKACTKQEDVDICNVQNIITAGTGQLVTGVSLIELKGKVNRKVFQVTVPTGRLVPPGIGLQIDGGKAAEARLRHLLPRPLHRRSAADRPAGRLVQEGSAITLTSVNFQNQPNPIKVALAGLHRRL